MVAVDRADVARDWYVRARRLRARRVVELGGEVFANLDDRYPKSYDSNGIVAPRRVEGLRLVGLADEVLGGAELTHRYVTVYDAVHERDLEAFREASYPEHQVLVSMVAEPEVLLGRVAPTHAVRGVAEVDEAEVAPLVERLWREEFGPGFSDSTVRDLVGRRAELTLAGSVHRLAVRDGGAVVANLDLVVADTAHGVVAEVDAVETAPEARGRGHGDALLAAAVHRAVADGARWLVLQALADDWPKDWYAHRGFEAVGEAHSFTRPAADL